MGSITRPRSQPSKRRAETEAAVLAAVKRLLFEGESFTELGINRIAKEAGVARSTFYLCFQDKTDVLIRLTGSMKDELFAIGAARRPAGRARRGVRGPTPVLPRTGTTAGGHHRGLRLRPGAARSHPPGARAVRRSHHRPD